MKKIIVIEGMDRCGKSSLANKLVSDYGVQNYSIIHSGKPPKNLSKSELRIWSFFYNKQLIEKSEQLLEFLDLVILDRSYLGEYVYGSLYRGHDYFNEDISSIEQFIQKPKSWSIMTFVDSPDNLIHRDDGKSLSVDVDKLRREFGLFKWVTQTSKIQNKQFIDWSNPKYEYSDECLSEIIQRAKGDVQ